MCRLSILATQTWELYPILIRENSLVYEWLSCLGWKHRGLEHTAGEGGHLRGAKGGHGTGEWVTLAALG